MGKKLIRHGTDDIIEVTFDQASKATINTRKRNGRLESLIEAPSDVKITLLRNVLKQESAPNPLTGDDKMK